MINVTTRYPALALFVIGLVFTVVALYFAQSESLPPFTIDGTLQAEDPADATVIISFPVYNGTPDSNGTIKRTVHPVFDNITYEVSVPGYNSPIRGSMLIKGCTRWGFINERSETFWTKTRGQVETG